MPDEHAHADNLKASRASSLKNSLNNAKKNIKASVNVLSLMTYTNPFIDWLFGIALCVAILKDVLDIANNALIAAYGSGLVLIFIFSVIASLVIGFIMLIVGASGKTKVAKAMAKRLLVLLAATLVEFIPVVDLLPIESLTVIVIFWMTLAERKVADGEKREKEETQREESAQEAPLMA